MSGISLWQTVAPVVSAVSALAGVALASGLSSRGEREQWRRDKKYEVYSQVTSAARTMLWRGDEVDASRADVTLAEQHERVRQAMFVLRERLAEVELLSAGEAANAARDLEGHFGNVLYPYFVTSGATDGQAPEVVEARRVLVRFQQAARTELAKT